jgi:arylformamidase
MAMSGPDLVTLTASSDHPDAVEAMRDALDAIGKQLAPAGSGPHGLVSMEWTAPDPAAFHPSRHAVDLVCREAFAGFTPPITLKKGEGAFTVKAVARVLPKPSADIVYRDYDRMALARQYAPRLQADFRQVCGAWGAKSAAFAQKHRGIELYYGPGRFETLDLFYPEQGQCPPVWVFFHGGYWQAMDKNLHAHFAEGMLKAGFAVAMVNYGLAPQTSLETILDQCRASLQFLVREAGALGIDASNLHIAGHSAGGQIVAMLAADEAAPPIKSVLPLSGVFDLEPLSMVPMGPVLGLNDASRIRALSPLYKKPRAGVKIAVAVGGAESEEFLRQSDEYAGAWKTGEVLVLPGANHFTLLDGLNDGSLLKLARAIAE